MNRVNENFLKLQNNYLFSTVAEKVEKYKQEKKKKKVINLGVGDVTLPLPKAVVEASKKACDEMLNKETFRGYGPELGYDFLKKKILEEEYLSKGIEFGLDEIFISDGINERENFFYLIFLDLFFGTIRDLCKSLNFSHSTKF